MLHFRVFPSRGFEACQAWHVKQGLRKAIYCLLQAPDDLINIMKAMYENYKPEHAGHGVPNSVKDRLHTMTSV